MKAAMGDYAKTADFETFVQRKQAGGVRNDIAELAGRRFVLSIEVEDGKRLAEALIKMITGRDTIRARFLYQESFEFVPQFKLWLAANQAPVVGADDDSIWRRIIRVPFDQVIPQENRDRTLKDRLKDPVISGPAILAWAVRGCLRWLKQGLHVPNCVAAATAAYRDDMDQLKEFFAEDCDFGPELSALKSGMWGSYWQWAERNGIADRVSHRQLADRLRKLGCTEDRQYSNKRRVRIWRGVGVEVAKEEEDALPQRDNGTDGTPDSI